MAQLFGLIAAFLYVVPIAAVQVLRARRDRELWEIGLDLPFAVALDLLLLLVCTRFMTLEVAAFVTRIAWICGTAGVLYRRRARADRPAWPRALDGRAIAAVLFAGMLALLISASISRSYAVWDRRFHIPIVSALRGEVIPFVQSFDPQSRLYYHFAGDALASLLQSLSFAVIHASHALSLAHDILCFFIGATTCLLLLHFRVRTLLSLALGSVTPILGGPLTFFRDDRSFAGGYSFQNWLTLSYRPHTVLAGLLLIGATGSLLVRVEPRPRALLVRQTAPVLIATAALLSISDEASLGIFGLALGVAWLVHGNVLAPKRWMGIAIILALGACVILPNRVFAAALQPGAPQHSVDLATWTATGYHHPPIPLSEHRGATMMFFDTLPIALVLLGGIVAFLRRRSRQNGVALVFYGAFCAVAFFALARVVVAHEPKESHRFAIGAEFLAPFFALYWYSTDEPSRRRLGLKNAILAGGVILGSVSSLDWLIAIASHECHRFEFFFAPDNHYEIDCRRQFAATMFEKPEREYLAKSVWYLYGGCHPVYSPGRHVAHQWEVMTEVDVDQPALLTMERSWLGPNDPLHAVCPSDPKLVAEDAVCAFAVPKGRCKPLGDRLLKCELPPEEHHLVAKQKPPPKSG